ncbi:MAG: hypothetical protein HY516_00700 [Candidatus Aenigmarchaeota archaeon]|nr:hypothetical protein [Candidatus Aenigmarchaeota archaeon]
MATKPAATTYDKVNGILTKGLRSVERQTDYTKMLSGASDYITQARAVLGPKPKSGAARADYNKSVQAINDFSEQVSGMITGSYQGGVQDRYAAVTGILKDAKTAGVKARNVDEQLRTAGSYAQQAKLALGPKPKSGAALTSYNQAERAINAFVDQATEVARNLMATKANETYSAGRHAKSGVQAELGGRVSIHASKNPLNWVRVGRPSVRRVSGSLSDVKEKAGDAGEYIDSVMQTLRDNGLASAATEGYAKGLKTELNRFSKAIERQETRHQTYAQEAESERAVKAHLKGIKRRVRANRAAEELAELRARRQY